MQMKHKKLFWDVYQTLKGQLLHISDDLDEDSLLLDWKYGRWALHPYTAGKTIAEIKVLMNDFMYMVSLDKEISIDKDSDLQKPDDFKRLVSYLNQVENHYNDLYNSNYGDKALKKWAKSMIDGSSYYKEKLLEEEFTKRLPDSLLCFKNKYREDYR